LGLKPSFKPNTIFLVHFAAKFSLSRVASSTKACTILVQIQYTADFLEEAGTISSFFGSNQGDFCRLICTIFEHNGLEVDVCPITWGYL
jgi:hypothetical protein